MKQLLTHSRLDCIRRCLRMAYYRYEVGIRRIAEARALRIGSAIHVGLDVWKKSRGVVGVDALCLAEEAIRYAYAEIPEGAMADPLWLDDWNTEAETIVSLIRGYAWYYANDNLVIIESERTFRLPIRNPETGMPTPHFDFAGKWDGIVQPPITQLAVMEHKSTGESIYPDADYWARLRIDPQISGYFDAALALGHKVGTVLYDVIRKPAISRYKATPIENRKYTKGGKLYANQREVDETPAEFGKRLLQDIYKRPEFYFQRMEIPRLESDLAEFHQELWQQQKRLRASQLFGWWFRSVSAWTCPYCEYRDLCYNSRYPLDIKDIPEGFVKLDNVHPELDFDKEPEHAHDSTSTTEENDGAAETSTAA